MVTLRFKCQPEMKISIVFFLFLNELFPKSCFSRVMIDVIWVSIIRYSLYFLLILCRWQNKIKLQVLLRTTSKNLNSGTREQDNINIHYHSFDKYPSCEVVPCHCHNAHVNVTEWVWGVSVLNWTSASRWSDQTMCCWKESRNA